MRLQNRFSLINMFNHFYFRCDYCDQCFKQLNSLKLHIRIHTGERPFACSKCMKCFVSRSQLANHTKRGSDCDVNIAAIITTDKGKMNSIQSIATLDGEILSTIDGF